MPYVCKVVKEKFLKRGTRLYSEEIIRIKKEPCNGKRRPYKARRIKPITGLCQE